MIVALLTGAGAGLGLSLIARGLRPHPAPLAATLARLRAPAQPAPTVRRRAYVTAAAPLARLGLPRPRVRHDLTLLQRDVAEHLTVQVTATLVGVLGAPMLAILVGVYGQAPVWLALAGGALGFRWADARLHAEATGYRAQMRLTLTAMLVMISIALAGGAGLEQALGDASAVCTGAAADRLRRLMNDPAGAGRRSIWQALGEWGERADVAELCELAAAMRLAGSDGARIRQSLSERASALRSAATTAMETEAAKANSRLTLPLVVIGLAYLIFLLYPPLVGLAAGL